MTNKLFVNLGRYLVFGAFVLFFLSGCGDDDNHNGITNKVLVGDGTTLILYSVQPDGSLAALSSAAVPEPAEGQEIYGIVKYPTQPWIYVTSMIDYSNGNGRIDRFLLDGDTLTYDGAAFIFTDDSGPVAGMSCVPTTLAFNSDGTRAYIDEDRLDVVDIFSVDAAGDFSFLWEGAGTSMNGLIVSPDDDKLYNGSNVIDLDGDTAAVSVPGPGGNANEIVTDDTGTNFMAAVLYTNELAIYGLADQSAPNLIAGIELEEASYELAFDGGPAMYQDSSADLSVFTVVGAETVATFSFDGATFTLLDQYFNNHTDYNVTPQVMNRGVAMTADGTRAVVAWLRPSDENDDPLFDGGITVYAIDAEGTLTAVHTITSTSPVRAVLSL